MERRLRALDVARRAGAEALLASLMAGVLGGSIWVLPDYKLVQLLLGLSTLVESSLIVTGHNFGKHGRRHF